MSAWDECFAHRVMANGECLIWSGTKSSSGYGNMSIKGRHSVAHRFSWEIANGRCIPAGMFVLHSCDRKLCVNPKHLRVGTAKENTHEMFARGRDGWSTGSVKTKLSLADAAEIRRLVALGARPRDLAARFGVCADHVSLVARGRSRRGISFHTKQTVCAAQLAKALIGATDAERWRVFNAKLGESIDQYAQDVADTRTR
jgi:hypothetical protein